MLPACLCLLSHTASVLAQWHQELASLPALIFVQILFVETPFNPPSAFQANDRILLLGSLLSAVILTSLNHS